ncbi:MAG: type II toxin-antitoxin system HicA family toxin [Solidesulfovibrio sp.]
MSVQDTVSPRIPGRGRPLGGSRKTLTQIFEEPTRADVTHESAVSLLKGYGAVVKEGSGSRVKIFIRGKVIQFHKPHQKELPRYVVQDIRDTLAELGITPE